MLNGKPFPRWAATLIGVAVGAGSVVAATYNKFETIDAHVRDVGRLEQMLIEKDRLDAQRYESIMRMIMARPQIRFRTPPDLNEQFPPEVEEGPDA